MKRWDIGSSLHRALSIFVSSPHPRSVNRLTVSVVYSAEAVSVNVVMIVDGVTRQLQTLLRRSAEYAPASAGGTGGPCRFTGGETTEAVALGALPVAEITVALLELHVSMGAVALLVQLVRS